MKHKLIDSFLKKKEVVNIFNILEQSSIETRIVGGCVRDLLLNRKIKDIDLAVKGQPEDLIEIFKKNYINYEDFGKRYGSIVAYINKQKFEITSLREDLNPQGRHTDIKYTNDWKKDALRRDFTMNSLYVSLDGHLYDFFNGQKDIKNQIIRFIGNVKDRIEEDYLRIFRYYRFLGCFEKPNIIENYEKILHQHLKDATNNLSDEVMRNEILKMFNKPYSINSFINNHDKLNKNHWIFILNDYWRKKNYELGLKKCLNKIDRFF